MEKTVSKKEVFKGKIIAVREDLVELTENNQLTYREIVEHPGAVCVAALTNHNTLILVNQFRSAPKEYCLEFVAGKKELDEDPLDCAKRELEEEAGVLANTWVDLGIVYPSPAYLEEKIHVYFAKDLIQSKQKLDENEFLELVELTWNQLLDKIESNEIKDLKTIALAYRIQPYLKIK